MRRCMEHHIRAVFRKNALHRRFIAHRAYHGEGGKARAEAVNKLLHYIENTVFADIQQYKPFGRKLRYTAAKLAPDTAARAGDKHRFPAQSRRSARYIRTGFAPADDTAIAADARRNAQPQADRGKCRSSKNRGGVHCTVAGETLCRSKSGDGIFRRRIYDKARRIAQSKTKRQTITAAAAQKQQRAQRDNGSKQQRGMHRKACGGKAAAERAYRRRCKQQNGGIDRKKNRLFHSSKRSPIFRQASFSARP